MGIETQKRLGADRVSGWYARERLRALVVRQGCPQMMTIRTYWTCRSRSCHAPHIVSRKIRVFRSVRGYANCDYLLYPPLSPPPIPCHGYCLAKNAAIGQYGLNLSGGEINIRLSEGLAVRRCSEGYPTQNTNTLAARPPPPRPFPSIHIMPPPTPRKERDFLQTPRVRQAARVFDKHPSSPNAGFCSKRCVAMHSHSCKGRDMWYVCLNWGQPPTTVEHWRWH